MGHNVGKPGTSRQRISPLLLSFGHWWDTWRAVASEVVRGLKARQDHVDGVRGRRLATVALTCGPGPRRRGPHAGAPSLAWGCRWGLHCSPTTHGSQSPYQR